MLHVKLHKVVGYNLLISFIKYRNFTLNILAPVVNYEILTLSENIWESKKNIMIVCTPSKLCSKNFFLVLDTLAEALVIG